MVCVSVEVEVHWSRSEYQMMLQVDVAIEMIRPPNEVQSNSCDDAMMAMVREMRKLTIAQQSETNFAAIFR